MILLCLSLSTTLIRRRSFAGRARAVHCISVRSSSTKSSSSLMPELELINFHSGCHDRMSSLRENRGFNFLGNSFFFELGLEISWEKLPTSKIKTKRRGRDEK